MTVRFPAESKTASHCETAAACSSARIMPNLDTALIPAVSICVLLLAVAVAV